MSQPRPPAKFPGAQRLTNTARVFDPRNANALNRGVLHMIDAEASDLRGLAQNHKNPPHVWWDHDDPTTVLQTVDLDKAARALVSGGPGETNHQGYCFQIEINGKAEDGGDVDLEALAVNIIIPVSKIYGLPFEAYMDEGLGSEAYGTDSPSRMSNKEWDSATREDGTRWGWCLHQNVPKGNSHWDAPIDMGKLMSICKALTAPKDEQHATPVVPEFVPPSNLVALTSQRTMGLGDTGWAVQAVQARLAALGYIVKMTGEYDDLTVAAFKEFETRTGYKLIDGIIGSTSWKALWDSEAAQGPLAEASRQLRFAFI